MELILVAAATYEMCYSFPCLFSSLSCMRLMPISVNVATVIAWAPTIAPLAAVIVNPALVVGGVACYLVLSMLQLLAACYSSYQDYILLSY